MWQAKGVEENVHNVVGVITWNARRYLVACVVRRVSCWQCLTSARRILHSTKCHPCELWQVHQVMGTSFSVFWILLIVIRNLLFCSWIRNCIFMFQGLCAASMAWYYAAQIPHHCLCIWLKLLSGLQCLPEGLVDSGSSRMSWRQ
jgi:hypothetical protein